MYASVTDAVEFVYLNRYSLRYLIAVPLLPTGAFPQSQSLSAILCRGSAYLGETPSQLPRLHLPERDADKRRRRHHKLSCYTMLRVVRPCMTCVGSLKYSIDVIQRATGIQKGHVRATGLGDTNRVMDEVIVHSTYGTGSRRRYMVIPNGRRNTSSIRYAVVAHVMGHNGRQKCGS